MNIEKKILTETARTHKTKNVKTKNTETEKKPLNHTCVKCGEHEGGRWAQDCMDRLTERQMCFTCSFWHDLWLRRNDPDVVRVNGTHMIIGDETKSPSQWRGHGGAKFVFRFHDGREVTSTNVWFQGHIPELWKAEMPDNAVQL